MTDIFNFFLFVLLENNYTILLILLLLVFPVDSFVLVSYMNILYFSYIHPSPQIHHSSPPISSGDFCFFNKLHSYFLVLYASSLLFLPPPPLLSPPTLPFFSLSSSPSCLFSFYNSGCSHMCLVWDNKFSHRLLDSGYSPEER